MILVKPEQIEEYEEKKVWVKETMLDVFKESIENYPERMALVDPPNKEQLVGLKPERLEITDDIPRNPLGKAIKAKLREDIKEKIKAE